MKKMKEKKAIAVVRMAEQPQQQQWQPIEFNGGLLWVCCVCGVPRFPFGIRTEQQALG